MEFDRKLYEVAEVDYSKAIEIEPENISFRLARAHFYNKTKRKKEAREDVRVAARLGATPAEVAGAAGIKPKK
jgi:Tfp pilus assembly protein PilF